MRLMCLQCHGRGEKYVVVEKREEWDGGSIGRVKTKGKRGKGFV